MEKQSVLAAVVAVLATAYLTLRPPPSYMQEGDTELIKGLYLSTKWPAVNPTDRR